MRDGVTAALIGATASVVGSVLTYLVGIRSLRRSVSISNGAPLGSLIETRLGGLERRLERIEESLSEVRELLASRFLLISQPPEPVWSPLATTGRKHPGLAE